jgi:hypothetical protein
MDVSSRVLPYAGGSDGCIGLYWVPGAVKANGILLLTDSQMHYTAWNWLSVMKLNFL